MWEKKSMAIIVAVFGITTIIGCGNTGQSVGGQKTETQASGDQKKVLTFVMAHALPASDFRGKGYAYFAEEVEKRSNGTVKIEVHPAQTLVKLQDSFEAITVGTVDMAALPSSYISNKVKDVSILDVTGSYPPDKWIDVEKAINPILSDILKEHNLQYLFGDYEATTAFTLRKGTETVKTPDLKGLKIRDYGKYIADGLKLWNAIPVNIPLSELNAAVQNKTVDGVYIGWPNIKSFKLYEPTPNITLTGLSAFWEMLAINMDSYNKMNDEQKKIFEEVKWEAMKLMEDHANTDFEQLKKDIDKAGGTLYTLTPDEKKAFLDKLKPVYDSIEKEAAPNGKRLIEALKNIK